MAGQSVVIYDVVPGGRIAVYDTAYTEGEGFVAWLHCLNAKGKATNPRVIQQAPTTIDPKLPAIIPRRPGA